MEVLTQFDYPAWPRTARARDVITAAVYGMLASSGLLVGALIGILTTPPRQLVAAVTAFGSGVLVSALSFDLMGEAFALSSPAFVIGGFLVGALLFVVVDVLLERIAARASQREEGTEDARDVAPAATGGVALLIGAVLDGISENTAIGISLAADPSLGLVLLAAVFLGNVPESLASAVDMRHAGRSRRHVVTVWGTAALACTLASVVGYALLGGLSANLTGALLALAAGGILAMLADTMMPQAFEDGGPVIAMATAGGFACAFLLSHLID
jgi:ZIP family zinc transporter